MVIIKRDAKLGKYIRQNNNKFEVYKVIKGVEIVFGAFDDLKDAKAFKYKLLDNAWNLNFSPKTPEYGRYIHKEREKFVVYRSFGDKPTRFGIFNYRDEALMARDDLINDNWGFAEEKILENMGITELSDNIGRIGYTFTILKWVDETKCIIFGFYPSYERAVAVRNDLIKHNWDESKIENKLVRVKRGTKYGKYISKVGDYYRISKMINGGLKSFGHYRTLEEATEIRDELVKNGWDDSFLNITRLSNRHENINRTSSGYSILKRIDGELRCFGSFDNLEDAIQYRDELKLNNWIVEPEEVLEEEKFDEYIYTRNDGKYYIKNEIQGSVKIYGIFDNFLDAISARLDCIKSNWNLKSIPEEEYDSYKHIVGLFENSSLLLEDDVESIAFPVTVGKSYKNKGWAIKRSYLEDMIPILKYEKECKFNVNGYDGLGKLNLHTRLFYNTNEDLSNYLKKLHDIDAKIQTKVIMELINGTYQINPNLDGKIITFKTKFSKSFKEGMFAIPREFSKKILPILDYESKCDYLINSLEVTGRFNLEFRVVFKDPDLITILENLYEKDEFLTVNIIL